MAHARGVVRAVEQAWHHSMLPLEGHRDAEAGKAQRRRLGKKGRGARDSTKYGRSRSSTRNFFVHHVERMGAAAQREDAAAILKQITCRKQQLMGRIARAAP